jgi:hypothetical protein
VGRTELLYTRGRDSWRFNTEAMVGPGTRLALYGESIPAVQDMDRVLVVRDVERAFQYAGWDVVVHW